MKNHRINFAILYNLFALTIIVTLPTICFASSSRFGKAYVTIDRLEEALYKFGTDVHRLPTQEEGLRVLIQPKSQISGWRGPYLKTNEIPKDPWGNPYKYIFPPLYGTERFDLYSFGDDEIDNQGDRDDISNWRGYNREYYKSNRWNIETFIVIVLAVDLPVAILLYFGIVQLKKRKLKKIKG